MKIIKKILLVLVGLVVLLLILALFVTKDFSAKGTVVIDKPRQEVFDYVKSVANQRDFGVWFHMDPDLKAFSEGTDGTEGFVYRWESKVVGNGSQTITRIVPGDSVISKLDFGFGDPPKGYFALKPVTETQTEVTWGIEGSSPYPWNLMNLFMDMNKDFETGVQQLKRQLED